MTPLARCHASARTRRTACATRITAAALGLLISAGLTACANGGANADSGAGSAGSAGSTPADAGGAEDTATDSGSVEQVDAGTSCSDLFTLARHQLDDAVACDLAASSGQCAGLVPATCGCAVAVASQTSAATQSYLNTLGVIQAKMCGGKCPPQFCPTPGPNTCVAQSGSAGGVCVHRP